MIVSLIKGIQTTLESKSRVTDLEAKKSQLESEKRELEAQQKYVESPEYLEKVAREELHLSKPGEEVILVPEELIRAESKKEEVVSQEIPNYLKWWRVFMSNEVK